MKKMTSALIGALMLFGGTYSAQALTLTPADADLFGNDTGVPAIEAAIEAVYGPLDELYKQDVGGPESGPFANSYVTEFFNTPSDPQDATITYVAPPPITSDPLYLLVKDGSQTPAWYLFDISAWNGIDTIYLNNFWPDQGAISHVSLYGTNPVPEPGTLLLLGSGLLGVGLMRRRRS